MLQMCRPASMPIWPKIGSSAVTRSSDASLIGYLLLLTVSCATCRRKPAFKGATVLFVVLGHHPPVGQAESSVDSGNTNGLSSNHTPRREGCSQLRVQNGTRSRGVLKKAGPRAPRVGVVL